MRTYAQFYQIDLAGQVSEMCGSDGVHHVDGRIGRDRQHFAAMTQAEMLNKKFGKGIVAYRLMRGPKDRPYTQGQPASSFCYMSLEDQAYARCLKAGVKCRTLQDRQAILSFIRSTGVQRIIVASLQDILACANCF